jgi:hypothetical protein
VSDVLVLAVAVAARRSGRASDCLAAVSIVGTRVMPAAAAAATVGVVSVVRMAAGGRVVRRAAERMRAPSEESHLLFLSSFLVASALAMKAG